MIGPWIYCAAKGCEGTSFSEFIGAAAIAGVVVIAISLIVRFFIRD